MTPVQHSWWRLKTRTLWLAAVFYVAALMYCLLASTRPTTSTDVITWALGSLGIMLPIVQRLRGKW